jgi:hypothetical protein
LKMGTRAARNHAFIQARKGLPIPARSVSKGMQAAVSGGTVARRNSVSRVPRIADYDPLDRSCKCRSRL